MKMLATLGLLALTAACQETSARDEARAMGGKSDDGADLCGESGYYGDGEYCDSFCPQPDPDCAALFDWEQEVPHLPETPVALDARIHFAIDFTCNSTGDSCQSSYFLDGQPVAEQPDEGVFCWLTRSRAGRLGGSGPYRVRQTANHPVFLIAGLFFHDNDDGVTNITCQFNDTRWQRVRFRDVRDALANTQTGAYVILEPTGL